MSDGCDRRAAKRVGTGSAGYRNHGPTPHYFTETSARCNIGVHNRVAASCLRTSSAGCPNLRYTILRPSGSCPTDGTLGWSQRTRERSGTRLPATSWESQSRSSAEQEITALGSLQAASLDKPEAFSRRPRLNDSCSRHGVKTVATTLFGDKPEAAKTRHSRCPRQRGLQSGPCRRSVDQLERERS